MRRIAVVGASLAGLNAARTLRGRGYDGELVVVGDEQRMPYDRPPLSKGLLSGAVDDTDVDLGGGEVAAEWLLGQRARVLDPERSVITTTDYEIPFDGLVLATGVRARELSVAPADREQVFTVRTLDDALALQRALRAAPRVLIVGAGFVGVEVATSARGMGCAVTLVGKLPPLSGAGEQISETCTRMLATAGVALRVGRAVERISTDDGVAWLTDGTTVVFDIVVVAIGSIPNTEWLQGSGLTVDNGVLCDAQCRVVGFDGMTVAGDVARWPNPFLHNTPVRVEHWSNAVEQGKIAALSLLGIPSDMPALPSFWSDHCGVRLQAVGSIVRADEYELIGGEPGTERYALAVRREGEVVGGLAYGMPREIARLRVRLMNQIREKVG